MAHAGGFYQKICYVCGTRSEQLGVGRGNRDDRVDLDGKPADDRRFEMACAVEVCPACGFSAYDMSVGDDRVLEIVNSTAYKEVLADESLSKLARGYLCAGLLVGADGEKEVGEREGRGAFWQLWAAWACDDDGMPDGAATCRRMAVESLVGCLARGGTAYRVAGFDYVVIADCLRRCGDFAAALEWIERGLAAEIGPRARMHLEFERTLVEAADTTAHLLDETPELAA
jgi:hypothetical protein